MRTLDSRPQDNTIKTILIVMLLAVLGIVGLQIFKSQSQQGQADQESNTQDTAELQSLVTRTDTIALSRVEKQDKGLFLDNIAEGKYGFVQNNSIATYFSTPNKIKVYPENKDQQLFVAGLRNDSYFIHGYITEQSVISEGLGTIILASQPLEPFVHEAVIDIKNITGAEFRSINIGEDAKPMSVIDLEAKQVILQKVSLQ